MRFSICMMAVIAVLSASLRQTAAVENSQYLRIWSSVELWTSRLEQQPSLPLKEERRLHADNVLELDLSTKYQTLQGFGGAITEASATTIDKLPNFLADRVIDAYYGPNGIGYNIARMHINSCDFSLGSYSFDDTPDDFDLSHFDRDVKHDNQSIIPFAKRALKASEGRLKFVASPWSPPHWMKGNNQMTGSSQPCLKEDPRYHQAWADYYVAWINAYGKHGIPISSITVQNEPEFAAPWEACKQTPKEQREFVENYLEPTLHKAYPDIDIYGYDHNKDHVDIWADEMYSTSKGKDAFQGIAVHWYSGDAFDLLEKVHKKYPDHEIAATEACSCPKVRMNAWDRAEKYAHDIIGDLNHWVTEWIDWNIVLDHRGGPNHLGNLCDAHIIVRDDWEQPGVHFQPSYYVMGHFSKFLPRGSIRIKHQLTNPHGNRHIHHVGKDHGDLGASSISEAQSANIASDNTNIEILTAITPATKTQDESVVIILFNPSNDDETVKIMCADNQAAVVRVPAHSIHTIVGTKEMFE